MQKTFAAFGLGCALLAGCAADPTGAAAPNASASRDEAYVPIGSNIPRRDPKRVDMPSTSNGLDTVRAGGARPAN